MSSNESVNSGVDLNLDAGESAEALADGSEENLYRLVSTVSIACGGHAGDDSTMSRAVELATKHGLAIGAHPSYPDREGFGRTILSLPADELTESLVVQIENLRKIATRLGAKLGHVKPHGALYNVAAFDGTAARAIVAAVQRVDPSLAVVGLAGSPFLEIVRGEGLTAVAEGFTDRLYEEDGRLRSRSREDALIADPVVAAAQGLRIARREPIGAAGGKTIVIEARTLCVHGDSPGALATARAVRAALDGAGVAVRSFR